MRAFLLQPLERLLRAPSLGLGWGLSLGGIGMGPSTSSGSSSSLLLESGDYLLQEDGSSRLLIENP